MWHFPKALALNAHGRSHTGFWLSLHVWSRIRIPQFVLSPPPKTTWGGGVLRGVSRDQIQGFLAMWRHSASEQSPRPVVHYLFLLPTQPTVYKAGARACSLQAASHLGTITTYFPTIFILSVVSPPQCPQINKHFLK